MADLRRSVILDILGRNKDANAAIDETSRKADALGKKKINVELGAKDLAKPTVDRINASLDILGKKKTTPTIDANAVPFTTEIGKAETRLKIWGKSKATATIDADDKELNATEHRVRLKLQALNKMVADPKLGLRGDKQTLDTVKHLQDKLKEYGKIREDAHIGVDGKVRALADIHEVEHALDALGRKSEMAKIKDAGLGIAGALGERAAAGGGESKGGTFLGKLAGLFGGGESGGGGGAGGGGLRGIVGTGGAGISGGLSSPAGIGSISTLIALGLAMSPAAVGGAAGIAVPGTLLGGQLALGQAAKATLKLDAAAAAKKQGPQATKNAQGKLAADSKLLTPLVNEVDTMKGLLAPIEGAFIKLAGPVTKILQSMMPVAKQIGAELVTMFRASLPFLGQFLKFLGPLAKALFPAITQLLKTMLPVFPEFLHGLLALVQGFALFLKFLGPGLKNSTSVFLVFMQVLKVLLPGIAIIMDIMAFAFRHFGVILMILGGPIGVFVGLILMLAHHVGGFGKLWHIIWNGVKAVFEVVVKFIVKSADNFWHAVVNVFHAIKEGVTIAWEVTWRFVKRIAEDIWNGLKNAAVGFWHALVHVFNVISSAIGNVWHATWRFVNKVFDDTVSFLKGVAIGFWHALVHTWNVISSAISSIWHAMWKFVNKVFTDTVNFLKGIAVGFWHDLVHIWNVISGAVINVWHTMWKTVNKIASDTFGFIKGIATGFWHDLVHIWNVIKDDVTHVWNLLWDGLKHIASAAVGVIHNVANGIKQAFKGPIDFVVNNVWDPLAHLFNDVTGFLHIPIHLPTPKFMAEGGVVPGTGRQDTVPAMLTPGERVLSLGQVAQFGGHAGIDAALGSGPGSRTHFAGGGGAPTGFAPGLGVGNKSVPVSSKQALMDLSAVSSPSDRNTGDFFSHLIHKGEGFLGKIAGWALGKIEDVAFGPFLKMLGGGGEVMPIMKAVISQIVRHLSQKILDAAQSAGGSLGPYKNPLRKIKGLHPERIDMGVDYAGSGPIMAIGPGTIVNTNGSGWPGGTFIDERLDAGAFAGKFWYTAENIQPKVHVGQKVNTNTVIGILRNASPNSEMGWASGHGQNTMAAELHQQAGGDPGGHTSAMGDAANQFLVALGAPSGIRTSKDFGKIPPGFKLPTGAGTGPGLVNLARFLMRSGYSKAAAAGAAGVAGGETGPAGSPEISNCVPLTYGVVTTRGILSHDEVCIGDKTVVYSPQTGQIEEATIVDVPYHLDAKICRIGNANWSVICTWDHRWITSENELIRADQLEYGQKILLGDGWYESIEYFEDKGREDTFCLTTSTGTWTTYRNEEVAAEEGVEPGELWTGNSGGYGLIGWTPPFSQAELRAHAVPPRPSGNAVRDMALQEHAMINWMRLNGWPPPGHFPQSLAGAIQAAFSASRTYERPAVAGSDVHFSTVQSVWNKLAKGGIINEPVIGFGTRSGQNYLMGEAGPEMVTPMRNMGRGGGRGGDVYHIHPPESATNPDAYALTVIQAIRTYKRHHGNQDTNIG